jgi:DNA-binding protein H-NS
MNPLSPARPLTREQRAVLARIQQICEFWEIHPSELTGRPRARPAHPEPVPAEPRVKYRHPVSGETWDGRGPQPDWLRHALLQEGLRVAELIPGD